MYMFLTYVHDACAERRLRTARRLDQHQPALQALDRRQQRTCHRRHGPAQEDTQGRTSDVSARRHGKNDVVT